MSDFGKKLAKELEKSKAKHDAPAQQEFAAVRKPAYFLLSPEEWKQLREGLLALDVIAERLPDKRFRITVEWADDILGNEGNCLGAIAAAQPPKRWLEQIELWERTEDLATLLPLG
jgi:hypothetical protein